MHPIISDSKLICYVDSMETFVRKISKLHENAQYVDLSIDELKSEKYSDGQYLIEEIDIDNMIHKINLIKKQTIRGFLINSINVSIIKTYQLLNTDDTSSDSSDSSDSSECTKTPSLPNENNNQSHEFYNFSFDHKYDREVKTYKKYINGSLYMMTENPIFTIKSKFNDSLNDKYIEVINDYENDKIITSKTNINDNETETYTETESDTDTETDSEDYDEESYYSDDDDISNKPFINYVNKSDIINSNTFLITGGKSNDRTDICNTILNDHLISDKEYTDVIVVTNNKEKYDENFEGLSFVYDLNSFIEKLKYVSNRECINFRKAIVLDYEVDVNDEQKYVSEDEFKDLHKSEIFIQLLKYSRIHRIDIIMSYETFRFPSSLIPNIDMIFINSSFHTKIYNNIYKRQCETFTNISFNYFYHLMLSCDLYKRALVINNRKSNKLSYFYRTKLNVLDELKLENKVFDAKYICMGQDKSYEILIEDIIKKQKENEYLSLKDKNIYYITYNEKISKSFLNYRIINRNRTTITEMINMFKDNNEYKFFIFDNSLSYYELDGIIGYYLKNFNNLGYFISTSRPFFCTKKIFEEYTTNLILTDHERKEFYRDIYFIALNDSIKKTPIEFNHVKRDIFDIAMSRYAVKNKSCLIFSDGKFFTYYF